ncbi:MAG: radical SAM protein [Clostridia bacterium]|nr:radical SAM protein [Clostridia bacterium]
MTLCNLCPRMCGVDRSEKVGACGMGRDAEVSKIMLHHFEEPCISGGEDGAGSGAIFFTGCSLKCVFCQNREISRGAAGTKLTPAELAREMIHLEALGAYNVNLVTPTHFTDRIIEALDIAKPHLSIPVVWNTSGYETPDTIRTLSGYVDIFLTDLKYVSPEISKKYSSAPDYGTFAAASLAEMVKIAGRPVFCDGLIRRGAIVRHLVLPGCRHDSIAVLDKIEDAVGHDSVLLSLMAQYTPDFLEEGHPELARRITTFEYETVLEHARELGFRGYSQSRTSALTAYTPDFKEKKVDNEK